MKIKFFIICLFMVIFCLFINADNADNTEEDLIPDYDTIMFTNSLLPGTAQLALGQKTAGWFYLLTSIPLTLAGQGLAIAYILQDITYFDSGIWSKDNKTYFLNPDLPESYIKNEWLLYSGLVLSLYGSLLSSYSSYAAHRDYMDLYGTDTKRRGRESLGQLLLAPYKPENIFNWDVFPFFPMTIAGSLVGEDFSAIGNFFNKETVNFMGFDVPPLAGLGLNTLFAFLLVTANAASEEIVFRGLSLETNGKVHSSLTFGAVHLANMLMPGVAVEDTILQTMSAALFGFYTAHITEKNGYNLEKAVTMHFWHNILAFTLGYLIDQGKEANTGLCIEYRIAY